jgi:Glycosyl hydrolases family 39
MRLSNWTVQKPTRCIYPLILLLLVACQTKSNVGLEAPIAPSATATAIAPDGAFWIDPSQDQGEISKFVLGANHGPWADLGVANLEPAKEAGITFLRWPGGNWGDQNDVQTYQIDNYILQAHLMGAEPSITVRLLDSTPEQAAQMVKYTNIDKGYGVKYWSIGNEPDLFIVQDQTWTPEFYAKRWREFALAMKAVDPTIKFYGPEISAFLGDADHFDPRELLYANSIKLDFTKRDYLVEFLKINADLVDIVAVHQYPFPKSSTDGVPTWMQLSTNTPEWDRIVPNLRRIVKETIGTDKPVGITEFNSDASNAMGSETSTDSFYNALWLADVLGRMIRTQPDIIAYWLLKNNYAGHGLMTSFDLHPTYYIYQLYKQFGNHLLMANSPEQDVSLFAARRDDGTITAIFVNRSDQAISQPFKIENGDELKLMETYLFDKQHNAEAITPPAFNNGDNIDLPALSATLYILR